MQPFKGDSEERLDRLLEALAACQSPLPEKDYEALVAQACERARQLEIQRESSRNPGLDKEDLD